MATESFTKNFTVDRRSEKCMDKIINSKKPTVINCKKTFNKISKSDILMIFANGKNKQSWF